MGMTIVMTMMCLTGSAMFVHDKMCIILPKCLVRVLLLAKFCFDRRNKKKLTRRTFEFS